MDGLTVALILMTPILAAAISVAACVVIDVCLDDHYPIEDKVTVAISIILLAAIVICKFIRLIV